MSYKIAGLLLALWVAGLLASYTLGGFIHILPLAAIAVVVFKPFSGPKKA